jgi:branched-chain amino acid aminotransferase
LATDLKRSPGSDSLVAMGAKELASVDGEISATDAAMIPLRDDGLYRGDGVFEVIRLYGGKPFALGEHLSRLERSAAAIELPVDREAIERELDALLAALGSEEAQLRIVLTRGGRRILLTERLPDRGSSVRLATVTYSPTVILTGVKSLSYAANMQATRVAREGGADEAVLVRPDGIVLEAPTSSIFWASPAGGLRTPAISTGILESITRAELVRSLDVEEGEFGLDELLGTSEAFLASTVREVQPVGGIDGHALQTPGPRSAEAAEAFAGSLRRALAN